MIGIENGMMTTIHRYTEHQPTLDHRHNDPFCSRAAAPAMITTSIGGVITLALALTQLKGKLNGTTIRVPTPNVSSIDLTFEKAKSVTVSEVNEIVTAA